MLLTLKQWSNSRLLPSTIRARTHSSILQQASILARGVTSSPYSSAVLLYGQPQRTKVCSPAFYFLCLPPCPCRRPCCTVNHGEALQGVPRPLHVLPPTKPHSQQGAVHRHHICKVSSSSNSSSSSACLHLDAAEISAAPAVPACIIISSSSVCLRAVAEPPSQQRHTVPATGLLQPV